MQYRRASRASLIGAVLSLGLICLVIFFKRVDIWHDYFDVQSHMYFIYNILRIVFLLSLVFIFYAVGRRFVNGISTENEDIDLGSLDHILVSSILGIAIINILLFIMGTLSLIRVEATLPLAILFIYIGRKYLHEMVSGIRCLLSSLRAAIRRDADISKGWLGSFLIRSMNYVFLYLILAASIGLLLKRGLFLYAADCDIPSSYIPRYNEIIAKTHGFLPTFRFIHYYTQKGAGAHFFGMSLSDAVSCQLVNFYLVLLCMLVLVQLVKKFSPTVLWASASALIFIYSPFALMPLAKNHVTNAAYFIFLFYIYYLSLTSGKESSGKLVKILFICTISSVIALPMNSVLIIALSVVAIILSVLLRDSQKAKWYSVVAILAVISVVSIYMYNYIQTGLFDMATTAFDKYIDPVKYNSWSNLLALKMQRYFNKNEGYVSVGSLFALESLNMKLQSATGIIRGYTIIEKRAFIHEGIVVLISFLLLAALLVIKTTRAELKDFLRSGIGILILLAGSMLLMSEIIIITYYHAAIDRATIFKGFFFLVFSITVLVALAEALLNKRGQLVISLILPIFIAAFVFSQRPMIIPGNNEHTKSFLVGEMSYADVVHQSYPLKNELELLKGGLKGKTILHLNFMPGAWLIPTADFTRPLQNKYLASFDRVHYGTPEEAIQTLQKHGIDYIYIDTSIYYTLTKKAPLFSAQSIAENFRIVKTVGEGNGFLLTLRKDIGSPIGRNSRFMNLYEASEDNYFPGNVELYNFGKKCLPFRDDLSCPE